MEKTIEFVERLGVAALSCEGYARIDGATYDLTPIVAAVVFHTCAIVSAASRHGAADALDEKATVAEIVESVIDDMVGVGDE